MTIEDIIGGDLSLLECMMRQGVDCSGMVQHVRFLFEKSKVYRSTSQSLIGFDLGMREHVEIFGPSIFCYGDHELTHRWLGVDALRSISSSVVSNTTKKSVRARRSIVFLC